MKIFGWIIFGLMCLITVLSIANDKQKAGARLLTVLLNSTISIYVLLTLI